MAQIKRREFTMLAKVAETTRSYVNWYMSEKLNGLRALWIPQSAGKPVEWANWSNPSCHGKNVTASGLWSRYGLPIYKPTWFTLPPYSADGELFNGTNAQGAVSATKTLEPNDDRWAKTTFNVFSKLPLAQFQQVGLISTPVATYEFRNPSIPSIDIGATFATSYERAKDDAGEHWSWLKQVRIVSSETLMEYFHEVIERGGEGLMLRDPDSYWEAKRSGHLVKLKPFKDEEALVLDTTPGKGQHEGRMGALLVQWRDKKFFIGGGFTHLDRMETDWIGKTITFRYVGVTNDGIPTEARYLARKVFE